MRTSDVCPTCSTFTNALCVIYNGANLPTLNIATLESLESALIKIEAWVSDIGSLGAGNIYTTNGTIPATTNRVVTLAAEDSTLQFGAANTYLYVDSTSVAMQGQTFNVTSENGAVGVNGGQASPLEMLGFYGSVLRLGTAGVETPPNPGQILAAADGTGRLEWVDESYERNGTTVAGLPGSPVAGLRGFVTDSTVAAAGNFGATVVGGGANTVPVFYDGANWIIA